MLRILEGAWDSILCLGFYIVFGIWDFVWDLGFCLGFGIVIGIWDFAWDSLVARDFKSSTSNRSRVV